MAKTLCEWSRKDIEKHWDKLVELTKKRHYICLKCARSACDAKHLCKAHKVKHEHDDADK